MRTSLEIAAVLFLLLGSCGAPRPEPRPGVAVKRAPEFLSSRSPMRPRPWCPTVVWPKS